MSLRVAAQQALEALEMWVEGPFDSSTRKGAQTRTSVAINALRTALAEPERKPLTDEEILRISLETPVDLYAFARAIERAHGIGGEA